MSRAFVRHRRLPVRPRGLRWTAPVFVSGAIRSEDGSSDRWFLLSGAEEPHPCRTTCPGPHGSLMLLPLVDSMITRWSSVLSSLSSLILAILIGGSLSAPAAGQSSAGPQQAPTERQRLAPDFTLKKMNGEPFQLSEHRGEIIVLNFWATWCPPCKQEIPGFIALQKEFREQGVTFVGVSLDKDGFSSVRPYAEKMEINYPLVVDDGTVAAKYGGVRVLPSTVLIGPEGKIRHRKVGFFPEQQLRLQLKTLLGQTDSSGW